MKSHRCLAGISLLLGASLSSGCITALPAHRAYETKQISFTATPTATPHILSAIFNAGGAVHGLGSAWYLWPTPVSPAWSQEIEDTLERIEKDEVPILGPIRGEFAPVFCMDPPSDLDIYQTLAAIPHGVPFLFEVQRKNVRFATEKLVDEIDPCRFYPLAGPCQLHHCHFKCTVWYDETYTMAYPVPWTWTDHKQEVLYIDKDHLHRCGEPGNLTGVGGSLESYGGYAPNYAGAYGAGAQGFGPTMGPAACGYGPSGAPYGGMNSGGNGYGNCR